MQCQCGNDNLMYSQHDAIWFCPKCWDAVKASVPASYAPASVPASPVSYPEPKNEAMLVHQIRTELMKRGWRVYRVGQHIVAGSGSDAGVPDLLCIRPGVPPFPPIVKLLEVKFGRNKPTKEQQVIIDLGVCDAVYSVEEALIAVGEISRIEGGE